MKFLKFILILLCITSCGTAVNYDYNPETDFNTLKSYNYFVDMKTNLSALDTKRIIREIDTKMDVLGIVKSETPDFYIDIQTEDTQNRRNSNVGVGLGGSRRGIGGGVSVGIPVGITQNKREIVIDFVDNDRKTLLWQAVSTSNYKNNANPKQRDAFYEDVIEKIFKKYPPKKK